MRTILLITLLTLPLFACEDTAPPTADPTVVATPTRPLTAAERGKQAFLDNRCPSCHKLSAVDKVAPGLSGVTKRHSKEWIRGWIANPQKTWEENHPETLELRKRYNKINTPKTLMELKFPVTAETIEDLIAFLEENDRRVEAGEPPVRLGF